MAQQSNIWNKLLVILLLAGFLGLGTTSVLAKETVPVKVEKKEKGEDKEETIQQVSIEAVVPVLATTPVKDLFVVEILSLFNPEIEFQKAANDLPLIELSYYSNLFSKTISINAP